MVKNRRAQLISGAVVLAAALGVALWFLVAPGGGPERLSASVAAQRACERLERRHYNAMVIITVTGEDLVRSEYVTMAGDDWSVDVGKVNSSGQVEGIAVKRLVKDGVYYIRVRDSRTSWNPWKILARDYDVLPSAFDVPCKEASAVRSTGAATPSIGGHHFVWQTIPSSLSTFVHDLWVDDRGMPLRAKMTTTEAGTNNVLATADVTYSNVGVTQTITAPFPPPWLVTPEVPPSEEPTEPPDPPDPPG